MKDKYDGPMTTITPMGMLPIKVTSNHPFLISKRKKIRVYRKETGKTRTREYFVPDKPQKVKAKEINKDPKAVNKIFDCFLNLSTFKR